MIAALLALAPFIPGITSIVDLLIKLFGSSDANIKAYQDMISKNKDAGLTTVNTAQTLSQFHDDMEKELEAKEAAAAQATKDQPK